MNKKWNILNKDTTKTLREKLLENRGINAREDIEYFFHPEPVKKLYDPFLLKGMDRAVERIRQAIEKKERMIVFGDYDVDGITGTAILVQTLQKLNAEVSYRLPDRQKDGYGLHAHFIEEFRKLNVGLMITVDCGITCKEEIALAQKYGIDVIITDHHSFPKKEKFPKEAYAIIHPKQDGCMYPWKEIVGAVVALKLAQALHMSCPELTDMDFLNFVDLAALGTVADCAPLTNENRHIVRLGLKALGNTKNCGLLHLGKAGGIDAKKRKFDTVTLGYHLAPRINAAGRMAHPYFALQLLLADNKKAEKYAKKLEEFNFDRKRVVGLAMKEAEKRLEKDILKKNILIACDPTWSSGIIGLIAGKLGEKYARPCIIMEERNDMLIGSIRSPENFSAIEFMHGCSEYFEKYGGHAQAGGFNMLKKNIKAFQQAATSYAAAIYKEKKWQNVLNIDCEIGVDDLNDASLEIIEAFEPFGIGNEKPIFLLKNVTISDIRTVGEDQKHLSFRANTRRGDIKCIAFQCGERAGYLKDRGKVDVVCHLEKNEWRNRSELQMNIIDFR